MTIDFVPLATVAVQFRDLIAVGVGPTGDRIIGELSAFDVSGDRLNARLRGVAASPRRALHRQASEEVG